MVANGQIDAMQSACNFKASTPLISIASRFT